LTRVHVVSPG
jgi:hypothetical protein